MKIGDYVVAYNLRRGKIVLLLTEEHEKFFTTKCINDNSISDIPTTGKYKIATEEEIAKAISKRMTE
jgi:hypothetical protein